MSQVGLLRASDAAIWNYAVTHSAIVTTKDEDFPRHRATASVGPQVIWLRIGNARRERLLHWFELAFPETVEALERGDAVVEVTSD